MTSAKTNEKIVKGYIKSALRPIVFNSIIETYSKVGPSLRVFKFLEKKAPALAKILNEGDLLRCFDIPSVKKHFPEDQRNIKAVHTFIQKASGVVATNNLQLWSNIPAMVSVVCFLACSQWYEEVIRKVTFDTKPVICFADRQMFHSVNRTRLNSLDQWCEPYPMFYFYTHKDEEVKKVHTPFSLAETIEIIVYGRLLDGSRTMTFPT